MASSVSIGQRFGRLTVILFAGKPRNGVGSLGSAWWCRCDCGEERLVWATTLIQGLTKGCGCGHIKHGCTAKNQVTRTYNSWSMMLQRCTNSKRESWKDYGGRGITVFERWYSFENFLADLGERPPGTTLDRFPNNDGNYEPGNVRWATPSEQRKNQRPVRVEREELIRRGVVRGRRNG
jgi:hypothetical protein